MISIEGAQGQQLSIVDVLGRAVVNKTITSDALTMVIPSAGVYIVKVGDTVEKVVVR